MFHIADIATSTDYLPPKLMNQKPGLVMSDATPRDAVGAPLNLYRLLCECPQSAKVGLSGSRGIHSALRTATGVLAIMLVRLIAIPSLYRRVTILATDSWRLKDHLERQRRKLLV